MEVAMKEIRNFRLLTFDCYGTLVDWKKGVLSSLIPFFEDFQLVLTEEQIFNLFFDSDREVTSGGYIPYREVLRRQVGRMADTLNLIIEDADRDVLINGFSDWQPFEDTVSTLTQLMNHFQLAIVSNIDKDLFQITHQKLGIPFDHIITAQEVGSYKPSLENFQYALQVTGYEKHEVLHIAQSLQHDIIPTNKLGIKNIWINRYNEKVPAKGPSYPGMVLNNLRELLNHV